MAEYIRTYAACFLCSPTSSLGDGTSPSRVLIGSIDQLLGLGGLYLLIPGAVSDALLKSWLVFLTRVRLGALLSRTNSNRPNSWNSVGVCSLPLAVLQLVLSAGLPTCTLFDPACNGCSERCMEAVLAWEASWNPLLCSCSITTAVLARVCSGSLCSTMKTSQSDTRNVCSTYTQSEPAGTVCPGAGVR